MSSHKSMRWPGRVPYVVTLLGVVMVITALFYARSLGIPFYSDDFVQIAWLRGLTFGELWTQVSPYDYYRPLAFSLWALWQGIGLPLTPADPRLLNLIGHVGGSLLVGLLVYRLSGRTRPMVGLLVAVLFSAYPFAYQAVIWVSAIFYPLVTGMMLGAVLAYLKGREEDRRGWLIGSLVLAGVAPFAHESGVLAGPLILAAEFLLLRAEGQRGWAVVPVVLNGAFLALWFTIRSGGVSTLDLSPATLVGNLTILITGLSYPLMPLVSGVSSDVAIWGVSLLLTGAVSYLMRKEWRVVTFALVWFGLSIGPVLVTMRPDWLIDAPRFLYPAGVGAAMLWALVVGHLGEGLPESPPVLRLAISGLVPLILIVPAFLFVYEATTWHLRGGAALWDVREAAKAAPDRPLLLVNLPNEGHPSRAVYPRFTGGAILLPPQVPSQTLAQVYDAERTFDDRALTVGAVLGDTGDWSSSYGEVADVGTVAQYIKDGYIVHVADYGADNFSLRLAGLRLPGSPSRGPAIAYFGDFIGLDEATWQIKGDVLSVSLMWNIVAPEAGMPTVFVHVENEAGDLMAQLDGDPVGGLFPFSVVDEWTVLADVRHMRLEGQTPGAVYVGVWDPTTGERLTTRGGVFPDGRVPVERRDN